MNPDDDPSEAEDWQIDALVAFDEALAAGRASEPPCEPGSPLYAVHECQRLLERIWPRGTSRPPELPRRFGSFLLHSELGRGGFGVVYLATATVLQRKVALKLPRPEIALTPDFRRRFLREGEAASRLDHPHIVPIFEIGEEGAVCYIASAYCEGITLAEWLRRRSTPLPAPLAADLLAKLALAVGHAHDRSILHRDLKPRNVLLHGSWTEASPEPVAAGFVPRICDFGLAKILDQEGDDTCSGIAIGSPAYMAPEQAAGRSREISPGTDVYALGVILYELLTGRTPFQGETVLETLRHVSEGEPPPLRSLRPGVPRDLDTICMKCLERRPDRRYRDGSDLADDLGRFLAARPIRAQPASG
ncbi:serine/threonine-protein kinase, partial [Singulisphaera rosea]